MRRLLLAAGAVAILVAISGCDAADPRVTPAPTPSATPVFASDEEALAAAEAAYAAYQAEVDRALSTYDTSGLDEVATGLALENTLGSAASFEDDEKKLTGASVTSAHGLVSVADDELQIYGCLDVSQTDVRDKNGESTVQPGGVSVFPMLVTLKISGPKLLVYSADVWDGDNFCA